MRYLPLNKEEEKKILELCGAESFEALSSGVPDSLRLKDLLKLPRAQSEQELKRQINELGKNNMASAMHCLLGQGAYDHDWPSVIDYLIGRGEFLTAYTPYQPEISQGTLQSIFEFQSMISELFQMDISNASLYDYSTSLVEAILMAARLQRKTGGQVVVSEACFDQTWDVLETYLEPLNIEIVKWKTDGDKHTSVFSEKLNEAPIAVVMQSPNKWGTMEDWGLLKQCADSLSCKSIASVGHMHSLAISKAPGKADIDICIGEGQALGIPLGFGGPYLGLLTCRKSDVRQMPGRLVGATVDANGKQAYCVTLSTREQHIRREKATSNICSNQNLMALRATVFMALMGSRGLEKLAKLSRNKAYYLYKNLKEVFQEKGIDCQFSQDSFFNEFSIFYKEDQSELMQELKEKCSHLGYQFGLVHSAPENSEFDFALSLAVTEKLSKAVLDDLTKIVRGA